MLIWNYQHFYTFFHFSGQLIHLFDEICEVFENVDKANLNKFSLPLKISRKISSKNAILSIWDCSHWFVLYKKKERTQNIRKEIEKAQSIFIAHQIHHKRLPRVLWDC